MRMNRSRVPGLTLVLFFTVSLFLPLPSLFAFDARTPPGARNVILISWDGVQREHLRELLETKKLPNLARLSANGGLVDIDVVGHQTDTKAGHTQMLTGREPETTGVYSNSRFMPIPEGLSIFEYLQGQFGRDRVATVMLTGKSHHIGSMGPVEARGARNKALSLLREPKGGQKREQLKKFISNLLSKLKNRRAAKTSTNGEPWYLIRDNLTVWDGDLQRDASQVGPLALEYLQRFSAQRLFAFFHFSDPDHAGHGHGENSPEYSDAIVTCDAWLGRILAKLETLGIADRTIVFVTSDHGFDEGKTSHKDAPFVFLATNDPKVTYSGLQRDIVPTILMEMGVDPSKMAPPLPGRSLAR